MPDLAGFREAVREYRRNVGRTQQQLARSVGLNPYVLSHKLNGRDHAVLTTADVIAIVGTLASWSALRTQTDVDRLLALMDVPAHAIASSAIPLSTLATGGPPVAGPRSTQVPAPPTPLIGRSAERAAIREALAASRLVTLTGVGGAGKTRLAVQTAHDLADRYADGAAFVDLAALRESPLLAVAIARALGLTPPSTEAAEGYLQDALRGQERLLVLDNLEQLLDATPLLGRLLSTAPRLRLLATSRIPLRLYGETVLRVPPLGLAGTAGPADSDAVRLFIARARAVRTDFAAGDLDAADLDAVVAICAALDGLPLAIELAAARVKLHPPRALLTLLTDRRTLLRGGPRDLPDRQRTLRAALDWSYELLEPGAQRLLACLGVFAGTFDAAAAAAVCGADVDENADVDAMLERLEELSDHSLVESVPSTPPGFCLLQTVREYALARLAASGERDAVHRRHLEHYLARASAGGQAPSGPYPPVWLDDVEVAYPNIRAAFDFACGQRDGNCLDAGLRLAIALGTLWQRRLSLAEGAWQFERLLALDAATHTAAAATRAHALIEQAALECFRGDYPRTRALAEQGRVLCDDLGDHTGLARAHRFLGEAAIAVGDDEAAAPHFRRQLAEAQQASDRRGQAAAYNMLGQVARHQGRYAEATALLRHALRLFGATHDRDGVAAVLNSLGEVARDAGDADRAGRLFTAALRRDWQLGNTRSIAYDLEGLGAVAALHGDGRQALTFLGAAQTLRERSGGPLPPVEQAILARIITPAVERIPAEQRDLVLAEGRRRPLDDTVAEALAPL